MDYVFSSHNVKYSDLHYATLVNSLKNWLSNLAQSNRQMNVDNDWAISLQISRTSEVPRGFGKKKKDFGLQSKVKLNIRESEGVNSPIFDPDVMMDVQIPEQSSLSQRDEERELFGLVSDNDNNNNDDGDDDSSSSSSDGGGNEYDDDSGMLRNINCTLRNENALTFFVNVEVSTSKNIVDYYSLANLCDSKLSNECLLVAIYIHHFYLTQPNIFSRMMKRNNHWLLEVTMNKLVEIQDKINVQFGDNGSGRGHWFEVEFI